MYTKRLLTGAAGSLALLGAAALATPASATVVPLAISINDGVHPAVVLQEATATDGHVTFSGGIGDFSVIVTTGLGYPLIGSPNSPQIDLNSVQVNSGAVGGMLTLMVTETGFTTSGPTPFSGQIGGTESPGDSLVARDFLDPGNAQFALTSQIGTDMSSSSTVYALSTSGNVSTSPSYSLTEEVILTMAADTNSSFDANLREVPEPASLAIFGAALAGLGMIRRRRKSA